MDRDSAIRLLTRQKEQAEQLLIGSNNSEAEIQAWKAATRDALTKVLPRESAQYYLPCLSNWQTGASDSHTDERIRLSDRRNGLKRAIATLSECIEVFRLEHSDAQSPAVGAPDMDAIGVLSKKQYQSDLPNTFTEATEGKSPLGMVIVDIDDFKVVNDKIGHDGGDEVLRLLAETLKKSVGSKGVVYRFGGDEFVVVLPNHSIDEAAALSKRLNSETSQLQHLKGVTVTVTIGVSAWPTPVPDIHKLFEVADNLLMEGKRKGKKNRVHVASATKTDIIGANEWRLTLTLSPEKELAIPKQKLLDYLINSCCSLPLCDFARRDRFPLHVNRSNLLQETTQEGWIGAKVDALWDADQRYEIALDGSARLVITQSYAVSIRAVQGDVLLHGVVHFWPFVTRFWKQLLPQMQFLSIRLDGIAGAYLSLDISLYPAFNLIAKVESYRSDDAPFLAASGTQGLNDLLLQTFHNVVTAFSPLHGVSTNDFKSQYFQREAESFLESVRDPEPNDE